MCAILGYLGEIDSRRFENSLSLMSHRGDDDTKILDLKYAKFGFNRLAIENISTFNQPFIKNEKVVVFNGEIYNYKKLIIEEELIAKTEVEVIYELYLKYSIGFVKKLDGMFAIAIYDKKLYLFRDEFGKKPLYFSKDGKIFASEIKAILSLMDKKPNLNFEALSEYLSLNSSIAPNTIYENIIKLPAGCFYDGEIKKYFDFERKEIEISESDAIDKLEELLINSVHKRLQSDEEIGSLLSGGIDSSLIATIASKKQNLKTFSIGYDGYDNYDERKWARVVAKDIKSEHFEVSMNKDNFFDNLDEVIDKMGEPIADSAYIPAFHLAKNIPLKVVFSGEGSDEMFLGYRRYEEFLELSNSSLPNKMWLKKYLERNYEDIKEWEVFRRFFADEKIFRGINETFYQRQIDKVLKNSKKVDFDRFLPFNDSFDFTYFDIKVWLGEVLLMKLDKMFMASSIEARSPFLDREVVNFVFNLPQNVRKSKKHLIKEVAKRHIPLTIVNRRKKGFAYPFLEWLKEENQFKYILTINQKTKLFNEGYLKDIVKSGHKRYKQHIWTLYLFSRWLDKEYL
jgi:asparagine synthase (glutamine-hydrolysing)